MCSLVFVFFFFSSRRRHTRCALVTGVQTCALPISWLPRVIDRDRPFRVRAEDADDLAVVSAYLQDAVVPVAEIGYRPAEQRFVMVASRFRWEKALSGRAEADGRDPLGRCHWGVRGEGVTVGQARGGERQERGGRRAG